MKDLIYKKYNIENKIALISGTTRGIGQALAEALIEAGCVVIALDRSDNDHLPEYARAHDAKFKRIKVDLLSSGVQEIESLIRSVYDTYSRIDILVNSAGITRRGDVHEFELTDWEDVLHVNLNIPFLLSKIVSQYFIKQGYGKIINIASMLSFQGGMRVPSYAASKHGIVGLTKSFSNGLAGYGINVNAIAPGFIKTDMTRLLQDDEERNKSILGRIPAGRWGEAEDIKGALYFLASPMSDYVNGTVLQVDGGWLSS